jgi:hypothetical protein
LRAVLLLVVGLCLWNAAQARAAATTEQLMAPSAAPGCGVPVAFPVGGPHRGFPGDVFTASDTGNPVTEGAVMSALAGERISAVAPADWAWSPHARAGSWRRCEVA